MNLGTEGNASLNAIPFLWTSLFIKREARCVYKEKTQCDECYVGLLSRMEVSEEK